MAPLEASWGGGIAEVESEGVRHRFEQPGNLGPESRSTRTHYRRTDAEGTVVEAELPFAPRQLLLRDDGDLWLLAENRDETVQVARTGPSGVSAYAAVGGRPSPVVLAVGTESGGVFLVQSAPPYAQIRVTHVESDGSVGGRAHHLTRTHAQRARLDGGWVAGDELHLMVDGRHTFRVHPRGNCDFEAPGPCDPRVRADDGNGPRSELWVGISTGGEAFVRSRAAGWERQLPSNGHDFDVGGRVGLPEAHVLVVKDGPRRSLLWLDREDGHALRQVELTTDAGYGFACIAGTDSLLFVAHPLEDHTMAIARVEDGTARELARVEGSWVRCRLAVTDDQLVIAAHRLHSRGEHWVAATLEVHFVDPESGESIQTHRADRFVGFSTIHQGPHDETHLVWSDGTGTRHSLWSFDDDGDELVHRALFEQPLPNGYDGVREAPNGPVLKWRSHGAQGEVPLCHGADEPREPYGDPAPPAD